MESTGHTRGIHAPGSISSNTADIAAEASMSIALLRTLLPLAECLSKCFEPHAARHTRPSATACQCPTCSVHVMQHLRQISRMRVQRCHTLHLLHPPFEGLADDVAAGRLLPVFEAVAQPPQRQQQRCQQEQPPVLFRQLQTSMIRIDCVFRGVGWVALGLLLAVNITGLIIVQQPQWHGSSSCSICPGCAHRCRLRVRHSLRGLCLAKS